MRNLIKITGYLEYKPTSTEIALEKRLSRHGIKFPEPVPIKNYTETFLYREINLETIQLSYSLSLEDKQFAPNRNENDYFKINDLKFNKILELINNLKNSSNYYEDIDFAFKNDKVLGIKIRKNRLSLVFCDDSEEVVIPFMQNAFNNYFKVNYSEKLFGTEKIIKFIKKEIKNRLPRTFELGNLKPEKIKDEFIYILVDQFVRENKLK